MKMQNTIFTIGHSAHTEQHFIALLQQHGISAVADVRSTPYSRANPQFNREELEQALRAKAITYVFLGRELGARSEDPACYEFGKVQYSRLAQTELFRRGLKRIQDGIKKYKLAIMCAEKEPLDCHRAILVARHLVALGLNVEHIHADGGLETHGAAVNRLALMLNLAEDDMFLSREEVLSEAYRRQEQRIAYVAAPTIVNRATAESAAQ
jgi:uncharacterized protein (DUF488 family)